MGIIFHLESGYSKPRFTGTKAFRAMTIEELKELSGSFPVRAAGRNVFGKVLEARTNGSPKTWKTRPADVSVSCKYGMYEHFKIEMKDGKYVDVVPLVEVKD